MPTCVIKSGVVYEAAALSGWTTVGSTKCDDVKRQAWLPLLHPSAPRSTSLFPAFPFQRWGCRELWGRGEGRGKERACRVCLDIYLRRRCLGLQLS